MFLVMRCDGTRTIKTSHHLRAKTNKMYEKSCILERKYLQLKLKVILNFEIGEDLKNIELFKYEAFTS